MRPLFRAPEPDPAAGFFPPRSVRGAAAVLLCVATVAVEAPGAPPGPVAPGSSSRPLLREELMHSWDLDFDGKVDPQEAEIARSKLRSKRMELLRRDSIDPLTGRKRGDVEDEKAAKSGARGPSPRREPERPIRGIDDLLDAGGADMATPRGTGPDAVAGKQGGASPARRGGAAFESPRSSARERGTSGTGRRGTTDERPGIATGGVRAGAPPARPGYGAASTPKESKPLNAGRPIGSLSPGGPTANGRGVQQPADAARPPARPGQPAGPR